MIVEVTHGDALFPASDGMLDPRAYSQPERERLLERDYWQVGISGPRGRWLTGGPEAELLMQATCDTFVAGTWVATILCGQATCERVFASLLQAHYAIRPEPKGWRSWGLGRYISHLREHELAPDLLLDQAQSVCDARKPFGHWREPLDAGTLERIGFDAYARGQSREESQARHTAQTAYLSARTAVRIYFGDLMVPPSDDFRRESELRNNVSA